MSSTRCKCSCGYYAPSRMSLSRHKQACRTVINEYMHSANVLQSVTTGKRTATSPQHHEQPLIYNTNNDCKFSPSRKASSWPRDKDTCNAVIDDSATEKNAVSAGNYEEESSSVDDDGSNVGDYIRTTDDDGMDTFPNAGTSLSSDNNDNYETCAPLQYSPPLFLDIAPSFIIVFGVSSASKTQYTV